MLKAKLFCTNQDCENSTEAVCIPNRTLTYSKTENKFIDKEPIFCPKCGAPLKEVDVEDGNKDFSNLHVGKWSSMSDEQKHTILKKRSDEHFNRAGREEKEFRKKRVIKDYLGGE